jgi:hypothetical protein
VCSDVWREYKGLATPIAPRVRAAAGWMEAMRGFRILAACICIGIMGVWEACICIGIMGVLPVCICVSIMGILAACICERDTIG